MTRKPFAELFAEHIRNRLTPGGLTVVNKTGPKATIRIYDEVGFFGITAEDFAAELDEITADEIEVQINSLGGDVFAGVAIYNALRTHSARITTRVDGMAASIASVIVQAGDTRIMLTGSQMMIHPAWGFAMGSASDMRDLADILDKQTKVIAGIYAERAGTDGFVELMEAETWFDADEAVDAGLADEVVKPAKAPEDRVDIKFSEQAESVITDLDRLTDRTEKVIAFRSDQGKPPLSEDSVEIFKRLDVAHSRLDVITSEPDPSDGRSDDNELAREYVRFIHQGVSE